MRQLLDNELPLQRRLRSHATPAGRPTSRTGKRQRPPPIAGPRDGAMVRATGPAPFWPTTRTSPLAQREAEPRTTSLTERAAMGASVGSLVSSGNPSKTKLLPAFPPCTAGERGVTQLMGLTGGPSCSRCQELFESSPSTTAVELLARECLEPFVGPSASTTGTRQKPLRSFSTAPKETTDTSDAKPISRFGRKKLMAASPTLARPAQLVLSRGGA